MHAFQVFSSYNFQGYAKGHRRLGNTHSIGEPRKEKILYRDQSHVGLCDIVAQ